MSSSEMYIQTLFSGHTSWVISVHFCPNNEHFVSGSSDGTVKVKSANNAFDLMIMMMMIIAGVGGEHQAVCPHLQGAQ